MGDDTLDLTVVIPLFDKAPYVANALCSVLSQVPRVREVIVVDDGSRDGGAELARSGADARVSVLQQANAGVSAARNRGIEAARGVRIAFLDADDEWLPGCTAAFAAALRAAPDADVHSFGYRAVDRGGSTALRGTAGPRHAVVEDFYARWAGESFTNTNSIVVARAAMQALGVAFPPGEKLGEDQDLWFRLAERCRWVHTALATSVYHLAVPGAATAGPAVTDVLPCYARLAERVARPGFPPQLQASARRLLASHWLNVSRARARAGDRAGAWRAATHKAAVANAGYWLRTVLFLALRP